MASLYSKVTRGVAWVTIAALSIRLLSFFNAIVLTHLLAPAEFGLMAAATAVIGFVSVATTTGLSSALIQRQVGAEDYFDTVWTLELAKSLILFLVVFMLAPVLAGYFAEPRMTHVLEILAVTYLFAGLCNIGVITFRKQLDFSKQYLFEVVSPLATMILGLTLALYWRNVWALVIANLANSIITCVLSYVLHPYRPRLEFSPTKARELFKFGKWIMAASVAGVAHEQGLTLFLGTYMGMTHLGYFSRAKIFSVLVFQQASDLAWKVGYPAFAQLQNDPEGLKQAFLRTLALLTCFGAPFAGGLFGLGDSVVDLILTDTWLPIVPVLEVFCLQSILVFISTPATILFQALGQPGVGTRISIATVGVLAAIIYPLLALWGEVGAAIALVIATGVCAPWLWGAACKTLGCAREFVSIVGLSLFATAGMVAVLRTVNLYLLPQPGLGGFALLVLLGVATYALAIMSLDRVLPFSVVDLLRETLTRRARRIPAPCTET